MSAQGSYKRAATSASSLAARNLQRRCGMVSGYGASPAICFYPMCLSTPSRPIASKLSAAMGQKPQWLAVPTAYLASDANQVKSAPARPSFSPSIRWLADFPAT